MPKCKVLALLLCESWLKDEDGKVTLHGVFDRIIKPRSAKTHKPFFVYYKIVVEIPCKVSLRVNYPQRPAEFGWHNMFKAFHSHDSFSEPGPVQSLWPLTTVIFQQPGKYAIELIQEDGPQLLSLASTVVVVDQEVE